MKEKRLIKMYRKLRLMSTKNIIIFLALSLLIQGFSSLQAKNRITVYPTEYPNGLNNPLKGFRPDPGNRNDNPDYPYTAIVRDYISWKSIENDESDGVQKIIDYCNAKWANYESMNIKVIPRVFLDWDSGNGNEYWPADLTTGDWTSQEFKDRVVKLIYKLGEAWDNDPRVAWVQTGIMGYWGEQESPVGINSEWAKRLGDAYTKAFKNKKLLVRNQNDWPGYEMGVYWDSYGHPGQKPWAWTNIKNMNAKGRYLAQVVEGEVAYNWGENSFDPLYGGEPTITLGNDNYTDNMIDVIRELHCTGLGWIASYKVDGSNGTNPATVKANASRMQKEFGYRFVMPEFSCSSRANQGDTLGINFKVKNIGSAPFYEKWPVAFVLIDESTKQIVWKKILSEVDVRNWHPGDNYNYSTKTYQTPAEEYTVNTSITIPDTFATGQYMAGITILEPYSQSPGVFFAVENFLAESQTQPLCRIGIGQDVVGSHDVNPSIFGDPVADDARYYTLTPQGDSFTLTTSATNGSISAAGNTFLPGTVTILTATGDFGYVFNSWGGDLSGSENPTTIAMNADKNVTAIFDSVATYELTTNATNGSIELKPYGGIYEEGTTVTLNAVPDFGYQFSEWSGELSGIENPATILMDSKKNVTANFSSVPIYTLATNATNGSIKLDPIDSIYEKGTDVTLKAISDFGYQFSGWSGDLIGMENPATISMDADKNVTANFTYTGGGTIVFATNCGGNAYRSGEGVNYSADMNNSGGSAYSSGSNISGTTDDILYKSERYGETFSYNINLPNGDYNVTLMFAEIYHNSAGNRLFNVALENNKVISNLDIWSWVGKNAAYSEIHAVTVSDGQLNISLQKVNDNAKISAIIVSQPDVETAINQTQVQTQTKLEQNYPNPFSTITTIPYQLNEASHVELSVFNFLGEKLTILVNQHQQPGHYKFDWDAKDDKGNSLPNGLYFYRFEINNHSIQVKKATLIKQTI